MISNTSNVEWYVKILAILKKFFFFLIFFKYSRHAASTFSGICSCFIWYLAENWNVWCVKQQIKYIIFFHWKHNILQYIIRTYVIILIYNVLQMANELSFLRLGVLPWPALHFALQMSASGFEKCNNTWGGVQLAIIALCFCLISPHFRSDIMVSFSIRWYWY